MQHYFLILMLLAIVSSSIDSLSSAAQPSIHKRPPVEPWTTPTLPNTLEPTLYNVTIDPSFNFSNSTFVGNVSIAIKVLKPTNVITLHAKNLTIGRHKVYDINGKLMTTTRPRIHPKYDYWVVKTLKTFHFKVTLFLTFAGTMTTPGFHKIPYFNSETGKQSWLLVTDLGPSNARTVFPCFDEPRFKATFRVTIRHLKNSTAVSNMPVDKKVDVDGSAQDTIFKLSPKMSSYLIGFVVTDFQSKKKIIGDGMQLRVWSKPGSLGKPNYAFNVTTRVQNYLHRQFNMSYPLKKLDQLAVPGKRFDGQQDSWGLATFKESQLLVDETKNDVFAKYVALTSISNSLVRNYFGNLVTCRYWNHVWLNEGLAKFYEISAVTAVNPNFRHKEFFYGKTLDVSIGYDTSGRENPLTYTYDPSKVQVPDTLVNVLHSYKGAALLRMVENIVGADQFKRGIRFSQFGRVMILTAELSLQYLKKHANGTVITADLWAALQPKDLVGSLANMMKSWVTWSGLPVVKVELLPPRSITATQKQFVQDPQFVPAHKKKWFIPLTYRISDGTRDVVVMKDTHVFNSPHFVSYDWVEFNPDRTGYYIVNYDSELWYMLTTQINKDHTVFTEISRSKFLSDALALVNAQQLSFDAFLNLTTYAWKEEGLAPWYHIRDGLNDAIKFANTTALRHLQKYILNLTSNLMDQLQAKDEGSLPERQLRPMIMALACSAGHKGCIENTTRVFQDWIRNETAHAAHTEYMHEVYCIGIANSLVESEWMTTFARYKRMTTDLSLLRALTCSRNATLLERLLDYSVEKPATEDRTRFEIISHVSNKPSSDNFAWKWLKRKYTEISSLHDPSFAAFLIPEATERLNTREQYAELVDFCALFSCESHVLEEAESSILLNIRWTERNLNTIDTWITQYARDSGWKNLEE